MVSALPGLDGLVASVDALRAGSRLVLADPVTLVASGRVLPDAADAGGDLVVAGSTPCIGAEQLILVGDGGPLRDRMPG